MSKAVVHTGECIEFGLNIDLVLGVEIHLEGLGAVHLMASTLAYNLSGVHNVLKDLLVDMGKSPRARARTLLESRAVRGLGKDGSLGDNNNVPST